MASHKEGKEIKIFLRPLYRLRKRGQTSAAMSGEFTPADIPANAWRTVYSPGYFHQICPGATDFKGNILTLTTFVSHKN